MGLSSRHRHELLAIVALLLGVFLALALVPNGATGPAGRAVGVALWRYLGAGAALVPVLGIILGLTGFGRFRRLGFRRSGVLVAGLVVLVPFAIAIIQGIRATEDLPATHAEWSMGQRAAGVIPVFLAVLLTSAIGTMGAILVGIVALSSLTLYTVDWHPFNRLKPAPRASEHDAPHISSGSVAVDSTSTGEDVLAVPVSRSIRNAPSRRTKRAPEDALDELPDLSLLRAPPHTAANGDDEALDELGAVLVRTLETFHVDVRIVGRTTGPVVTQFEVAPAPGVKVGRIAALADDLALAMRAKSIRIVAPIPGKGAVGVEVPNPTPRMVALRELIEAPEWDSTRATLPIALGRNLEGRTIVADLAQMPHLLIAGATGAGKSVCINTIITSLIYRYTPRELRMLMIDPKMVELSMYNTLPHLRHPVVTNNKQAAKAFKWAMLEMERRYELFHANGARNVHDFNRKVAAGKEVFHPIQPEAPSDGGQDQHDSKPESAEPYRDGPLPYIVIVVDELADLMMTVQGEVEKPLAILAQKARATGIHLILSTQRPSVNVITGLIKANFPSRIAFRVASKVDSRTILDQNGAEALLGNGDLLFLPPGKSEPIRVQGAFISTEESEEIMEWYEERKAARDAALAKDGIPPPEATEEDILDAVRDVEAEEASGDDPSRRANYDELFREAAEICISHQLGSTSLLQRKLRIGYGRAARIIDQLHEAGVLGPPDGSKPREVLLEMDQLERGLVSRS